MEEALANKFLTKLLAIQSISGRLKKLLALGAKRAGLGILNPKNPTEKTQLTSLACIERLVESLIMGYALSTINHRECLRRSIRDGRGIKKEREEMQLDRENWSEINKGRLRLDRDTVSGAWLTVVPELLNGATLLSDKFRDNLRILFGLHPQEL